MALKHVIESLEKLDPEKTVPYGFGEPMSYRGDYYQVAFEPVENAKIGDMLKFAKEALGAKFGGYKGGVFTMTEWSECFISPYGESGGDRIGPTLLRLWKHLSEL